VGRPREHGEQTSEALLATAERLLAEDGPDSLSMRRVADETGTTVRAIYSLFGSKEELLRALYREGHRALVRSVDRVRLSDDPAADLLNVTIHGYRRFALEHPNLYRLLFERLVPEFVVTPADFDHARASFRQIYDQIDRCIRAGLIVDRSAGSATYQWFATVHGLTSLELQGVFEPRSRGVVVWKRTLGSLLVGLGQPLPSPKRGQHRARA
jgi:AcrR family transcriptional regulator